MISQYVTTAIMFGIIGFYLGEIWKGRHKK